MNETNVNDIVNEEYVEELMQKMEALTEDMRGAIRAKDQKAQKDVLLRVLAIEKELEAIQAAQRAKLSALLDLDDVTDADEQVARLLLGFELGAKLSHLYSDVAPENDARNAVMQQTYAVGHALDAIGTGRRLALATFLDHPHLSVRAMAAASLPDLLPEKAIPVLTEIQKTAPGTSASMVALTTLTIYEHRNKT